MSIELQKKDETHQLSNAIDPVESMAAIDNARLKSVAGEVRSDGKPNGSDPSTVRRRALLPMALHPDAWISALNPRG